MLTDRDMIRLSKEFFSAKQLDLGIAQQYAYADDRWAIQPKQFQPVSLDLRLGDVTDQDGHQIVDDFARSGFWIEPAQFILGNTIERMRLGSRLWGKVEGKSTRARQGLLVEAAGLVDPGFNGTLTLELYNMSSKAIELTRGMLIAQAMFGWTNSDPLRIYGDPELGSHYQGQSAPTPARLT